MPFVLEITLLHTVLYAIWKYVAYGEKQTRADGALIPSYLTSNVGNPIGITLVVVGFGLLASSAHFNVIAISLLCSMLLTLLLHFLWGRDAKRRTIGLYLRSGITTPAGKLHLVYVVFVCFIVILFLLSWNEWSAVPVTFFFFGLFCYGVTVVVDKARGVI